MHPETGLMRSSLGLSGEEKLMTPLERPDPDRTTEQLLAPLRPNEFALKDLFLRNVQIEDLNEVYDLDGLQGTPGSSSKKF